MTIHVVCLDGTGQVKTQANPTNIAEIFDSLGRSAVDAGNGSLEVTSPPDTPAQLGKYLPGVGTQGNAILEFLGKSFGDGIAEQIVRGYTFLSRNYAAQDQIFIIGFSRGAAAARALAGFVAVQGLLDPTRYDPTNKDTAYVRAIAAWYQYRSGNPALANQARLGQIPLGPGQGPPQLTPADYIGVARIDAVGVFDTVSSLGVPNIGPDGTAIYDFNICDTVLNDKIVNGFHALSADEVRGVFAATFWSARAGILQTIFPGSHSNVGGGYPEKGLSDGALEWMLDRLAEVGLNVAAPPPAAPFPLDIARDDSVVWPFNLLAKQPRSFPPDAAADPSIAARWGQVVRVLTADISGPYAAQGSYQGGKPLYP
jgi:uncharacterized protein (DUF2235 family)